MFRSCVKPELDKLEYWYMSTTPKTKMALNDMQKVGVLRDHYHDVAAHTQPQ